MELEHLETHGFKKEKKKKEPQPESPILYKFKLKWITDNIKLKTKTVLIGENLQELTVGNKFLDLTLKSTTHRKIN